MIGLLGQLDELTEAQRAIRDHFQKGGSILSALLVFLFLALLVFVTYWLSTRIGREDRSAKRNDPAKLFHDLLSRSGLAVSQRKLLARLTRDERLGHPAVILLCPALFDEHAAAWQRRRASAGAQRREVEAQALRRARQLLFG